jgi:hypothetical protein
MGWIICPGAGWLSNLLDGIYNAIAELLTVSPIVNDDKSPIYMVWSYVRDLANVIFIIGFLLVIISQISGMGISNYGIKKMMPKIVLAAVFINLSFILCAIAVDASNIIGHSLTGVFDGIRDQIINSGAMSDAANVGIGELFGIIIGGTGMAALGIGIAAGFSFKAVLWLALPLLLGAVIAVIAALVTIVARQAIIYLLIMVSPLAVVAYMLPNTSNLYKKWYDLLMKMLIMFPMFAFLFGASRAAGFAILASADSIWHVILGVCVQVFPLVFAPTLFKASGSILGKVNDFARRPFNPLQTKVGGLSQANAKSAADYATSKRLANNKWYTGAWFQNRLSERKALRDEDTVTNQAITSNRIRSYVDSKYSLRDKNGKMLSKPNRRLRTALEATKAVKEAELSKQKRTYDMDDFSEMAALGTLALTGRNAVKLTALGQQIDETQRQIREGKVRDKADELAIEEEGDMYRAQYASTKGSSITGTDALAAIQRARYLKLEAKWKGVLSESEKELLGKYKFEYQTEIPGPIHDFLTRRSDSYTLYDFDGSVKRIVTGAQKDDAEFANAVAKMYVEQIGDPQGIIDIIVANEGHKPGRESRTLVINRKMSGYLADTVKADTPFLNAVFAQAVHDGKITSQGHAYQQALEVISGLRAKEWSTQNQDSLKFIDNLITGRMNATIQADTGMSAGDVDALIKKAAARIKQIDGDLTSSASDRANIRYDTGLMLRLMGFINRLIP